MRLNSKGQVTIPAALREKYKLHEGDEVDIVEEDGSLRIVRTETGETRGQRLVRGLRDSATAAGVKGMTTDELMDLLRG